MITNKMLLSSSEVNVFPPGETRLEYPPEELILNPALSILGTVTGYSLDVYSGIKLPKNNCTVILGVTDEMLSIYKDKLDGSPQEDELVLEIDISIPVSQEDIETVMYSYKDLDITTWEPSSTEVYVQINFTTKKEYVFYPRYYISPIFAKYMLSNGNEVVAFPKFYVRMSNEIHKHGPYNEGSTEPFIITVDNSYYNS